MWDWVGGRYSLWSAVGFAVQLAIGRDGFAQMLAGAARMDSHVLDAPIETQPGGLACADGCLEPQRPGPRQPRRPALRPAPGAAAGLPAAVGDGKPGQVGAAGRHAGAGAPRCRCCGAVRAPTSSTVSSRPCTRAPIRCRPISSAWCARRMTTPTAIDALLANLLAQTQALANGARSDDRAEGLSRRPSLDACSCSTNSRRIAFGALLAMYEHSVYVQSVLWGINAFDQWGVELGKQIAGELMPALSDDSLQASDPVTSRAAGRDPRPPLSRPQVDSDRLRVLGQGPGHVLAHQRAGVVATRGQGRQHRRRGGRIAQRHRDVAQPAFVAGATDRRAFGATQELVPRPTRTARPAWRGRGRCARGNRARRCAPRTCSRGRPAGSRRSRRCGCRSAAAAPRGMASLSSMVR